LLDKVTAAKPVARFDVWRVIFSDGPWLDELAAVYGSDPDQVDGVLMRLRAVRMTREAGALRRAMRERKRTIPLSEKPVVWVGPEFHKLVSDAVAVLGRDESLYERNGDLARVIPDDNGGTVRPVATQHLRERLSAVATWMRVHSDGEAIITSPPKDVAQAVLERGAWPVRPLEGIVMAPVLRPDGTVLQTPGYDEATRLLYAPAREYPEIPDRPTRDDARQAILELLGVVCDFPLASAVDQSAWLAAVLTLPARYAVRGNVPMFMFEANRARTGKTKLAMVASIIGLGYCAHPTATKPDDDGMEKVFTALVKDGTRLVLLDNATGLFGWPILDLVLTSAGVYAGRILGESTIYRGRHWLTVFATANNARFSFDTIQRTVRIHLVTDEEHPERRGRFRIPYPEAYAQQHHPHLLAAALTILRAFVVSGGRGRVEEGRDLPGLGGFEVWSRLVREAIVWAGYPDCVRPPDPASVETGDAWPQLMSSWEEGFALGQSFTALDLRNRMAKLGPESEFREALQSLVPEKGDAIPSARRLGIMLANHRDQVVAGRRLRLAIGSDGQHIVRHNVPCYQVFAYRKL
jgi:hypothetical protein